MTTIVVVQKDQQVAIAADTLVTFGDTRLGHRFEANSKIFKVDAAGGLSYVALAGSTAHFPVLRKAMAALPRKELLLGSFLGVNGDPEEAKGGDRGVEGLPICEALRKAGGLRKVCLLWGVGVAAAWTVEALDYCGSVGGLG